MGIYYGTLIYRLLYTNKDPDQDVDPLADVIGVVPGWLEDLAAEKEAQAIAEAEADGTIV